jgi:formate dehydrogenase maturation protein FdhE
VYEQVGQRLRQEAARRPELASIIELYCALLEAQGQAQVEPGVALDAAEAAARLEQGLPLLSPEALAGDGPALADLCERIASIVADHQPELNDAVAAVRGWLNRERERLGALAVEYLREGRIGEGEDEDVGLLAFIFDSALRPFLRARAQALAPLVKEGAWYRGSCPVCGGEADRLSVCEVCRRYIKTIDLRQVAGERLLAAERILTLGMDLAAQEAGYRDG